MPEEDGVGNEESMADGAEIEESDTEENSAGDIADGSDHASGDIDGSLDRLLERAEEEKENE